MAVKGRLKTLTKVCRRRQWVFKCRIGGGEKLILWIWVAEGGEGRSGAEGRDQEEGASREGRKNKEGRSASAKSFICHETSRNPEINI
jgi:hypothetical protein